MQFRNDINGLRAYAVIAVLIFHYNPLWLSGGFSGVDVFFVISGFLMTSIILTKIDKNNFSIFTFYSARIKRIIPALLFLIGLLIIFGYLFFSPGDYHSLAKHAGSSLLFISNFIYKNEAGYFDVASYHKYLLHTWSLSVEWQFYLLYPLILIFFKKILIRFKITLLLISLTFLFFILSLIISFTNQEFAYFLLPARAWELLLGSIAYLVSINKERPFLIKTLELGGFIAIFLSFFIINSHMIWPGYAALLPTIGTLSILIAANNNSLLTRNWICQKLGTYSYSLYLYHWPILVIALFFDYKIPLALYLLLSLFFAMFSYHFIEARKWQLKSIATLFVIIFSLSLIVFSTNGANFRGDSRYELTPKEYQQQYYGGIDFPSEESFINSSNNQYDFFVLGDSFARQYSKYMIQNQISSRNWFRNGCLISIDLNTLNNSFPTEACRAQSEYLYNTLLPEIVVPLIWAQSWDFYTISKSTAPKTLLNIFNTPKEYLSALSKSIEKMIHLRNGKPLYLIGSTKPPEYNIYNCLAEQDFSIISKKCPITSPYYELDVNKQLKELANKYPNVYFIDPNNVLCKDGECFNIIGNEPVFSDMSHLSTYGAAIVGKYIFDEIAKTETNKL